VSTHKKTVRRSPNEIKSFNCILKVLINSRNRIADGKKIEENNAISIPKFR